MFCRNTLKVPEGISAEDKEIWKMWEKKYGPLVLGDKFGEMTENVFPDLRQVGWSSLYSIGIIVLYHLKALWPQQKSDINRIFELKASAMLNQKLVEDFWSERQKQIDGFLNFCSDWGLSSLINLDNKEINVEYDYEKRDQKIFGLHLFDAMEEVKDYILLWKTYDIVEKLELIYHRLISSRGIDLICSELISNAIDHGLRRKENSRNRTGQKAFILAKLCRPESAFWALKFDKIMNFQYLTDYERHFYEESSEFKIPLLQIVIADPGEGFGGNKQLEENYNDINKSYRQDESVNASKKIKILKEVELIKYALKPEVSTKIFGSENVDHWRKILKGVDGKELDPTKIKAVVHGLSEVNIFIREFSGFWRIHSNATIYDLNYSEANKNFTSKHMIGRNIPGCLHYIMLPIKAKEYKRIIFPGSSKQPKSVFRVLDSAKFIYKYVDPNLSKESDLMLQWQRGIIAFCKEIIKYSSDESASPVLINITSFNSIKNKEMLYIACAIIADTLHRFRDNLAIFICGASDETKSILKRSAIWKDLFLDRRVIPFISLYGQGNKSSISIEISDALGNIKEKLENVLAPWDYDASILKSNVSKIEWGQLDQILEHNRGLFEIIAINQEDYEFRGKLKLNQEDASSHNFLIGGRSIEEFRNCIKNNKAIAFSNDRFLRFGNYLKFYIHLASLWADNNFKSHLIDWLAVAAKNIDQDMTDEKGKNVVFLPLLHPAIEIAHKLLEDPEFADSDIVEIRRSSELRWDSPNLLKLCQNRHKKIICLIDVVSSGKTITRLIEALKYIGIKSIGILSIISINYKYKMSVNFNFFSFCECSTEQLLELKNESKNYKNENRIIDADSQVTIPIGNLSKEWSMNSFSANKLKVERTKKLVDSGHIVFCHGIYGIYHHVFFLNLRNMKGYYKEIVKDIKDISFIKFNGLPDLILYPGESTITYILEIRDNNGLFNKNACIVLSPIRHSYGQYELKMELSGEHRKILKRKSPLRILFIDDSINSGNTEFKAKNAFIKIRNKTEFKGEDCWLTYIIMRRGKQFVSESVDNRVDNKINFSNEKKLNNPKLVEKSEFYCEIGPLTMTKEVCPFVPARRWLLETKEMVKNLRIGVTTLIDNLYKYIEGVNIEDSKMSTFLLDRNSTYCLLYLCELDIPLAVVQILNLISNNNYESEDKIAASLIYLSLYYQDVMSYVGIEQMEKVILKYTSLIREDVYESSVILLASILLLPCSVSVRLVNKILELLIKNKNINTATAILAIMFSKYNYILKEVYGTLKKRKFRKVNVESNDSSLIENQFKLIEKINNSLNGMFQGLDKNTSDLIMYITSDFKVICSGLNTDDIVMSARKLAALVYPNTRHYSFLPKQLENLDQLNFHYIIHDIKRANNCLLELYEHINLNLEDRITKFVKDVKELSDLSSYKNEFLNNFKEEVLEWSDYVLNSSRVSSFFYSTKRLFENINVNYKNFLDNYANCNIYHALKYQIIKPDQSVLKFNCLGPNRNTIESHFENMMKNPLEHLKGSNGEEITIETKIQKLIEMDTPLLCIYFVQDTKRGFLKVIFADRSSKVNEDKLFDSSSGLGSSKIGFNFFGGDIEYIYCQDGLSNEKIQKNFITADIYNQIKKPQLYKNIFISQFQIIWENREWEI